MRISAILVPLVASLALRGSEIRGPQQVTAGSSLALASTASGQATFYLISPTAATKRGVEAGGAIKLDADALEHAGRYTAILCASDGCSFHQFFVRPAAANRLSLLVHPSRVPVGTANGISAVALVYDNFHNLVVESQPVTFSIMPKNSNPVSATRQSEQGVAWVRLTSAQKEGSTRIAASIGHANEIRVVQQVASDACNLRIKATRVKREFMVETDPVHDCAGNAVPDGTIVSFTKIDRNGKTTVDVPIKRGVARVEMPIAGQAKITVASGVVTGNELAVQGGG